MLGNLSEDSYLGLSVLKSVFPYHSMAFDELVCHQVVCFFLKLSTTSIPDFEVSPLGTDSKF